MGESRDTASENRAVGLGHLVWPLVPARLLYFVAHTAAPLALCAYQADRTLPLPVHSLQWTAVSFTKN